MRDKASLLLVASMLSVVSSVPALAEDLVRIQFTLNGTVVKATLENNPASRDLVAMLPLTVSFEDHASTEKVAYLQKPLSTKDAPDGIEPRAGDVAYYAPWGNLAFFHKDFHYSSGLLKLGRVDGGFEALLAAGSAEVTIELQSDEQEPTQQKTSASGR